MASIGASDTAERVMLGRKAASAFLRTRGYPVSPRTLARLANRRSGPPYVRFMKSSALYDPVALLWWARRQCEIAGGSALDESGPYDTERERGVLGRWGTRSVTAPRKEEG